MFTRGLIDIDRDEPKIDDDPPRHRAGAKEEEPEAKPESAAVRFMRDQRRRLGPADGRVELPDGMRGALCSPEVRYVGDSLLTALARGERIERMSEQAYRELDTERGQTLAAVVAKVRQYKARELPRDTDWVSDTTELRPVRRAMQRRNDEAQALFEQSFDHFVRESDNMLDTWLDVSNNHVVPVVKLARKDKAAAEAFGAEFDRKHFPSLVLAAARRDLALTTTALDMDMWTHEQPIFGGLLFADATVDAAYSAEAKKNSPGFDSDVDDKGRSPLLFPPSLTSPPATDDAEMTEELAERYLASTINTLILRAFVTTVGARMVDGDPTVLSTLLDRTINERPSSSPSSAQSNDEDDDDDSDGGGDEHLGIYFKLPFLTDFISLPPDQPPGAIRAWYREHMRPYVRTALGVGGEKSDRVPLTLPIEKTFDAIDRFLSRLSNGQDNMWRRLVAHARDMALDFSYSVYVVFCASLLQTLTVYFLYTLLGYDGSVSKVETPGSSDTYESSTYQGMVGFAMSILVAMRPAATGPAWDHFNSVSKFYVKGDVEYQAYRTMIVRAEDEYEAAKTRRDNIAALLNALRTYANPKTKTSTGSIIIDGAAWDAYRTADGGGANRLQGLMTENNDEGRKFSNDATKNTQYAEDLQNEANADAMAKEKAIKTAVNAAFTDRSIQGRMFSRHGLGFFAAALITIVPHVFNLSLPPWFRPDALGALADVALWETQLGKLPEEVAGSTTRLSYTVRSLKSVVGGYFLRTACSHLLHHSVRSMLMGSIFRITSPKSFLTSNIVMFVEGIVETFRAWLGTERNKNDELLAIYGRFHRSLAEAARRNATSLATLGTKRWLAHVARGGLLVFVQILAVYGISRAESDLLGLYGPASSAIDHLRSLMQWDTLLYIPGAVVFQRLTNVSAGALVGVTLYFNGFDPYTSLAANVITGAVGSALIGYFYKDPLWPVKLVNSAWNYATGRQELTEEEEMIRMVTQNLGAMGDVGSAYAGLKKAAIAAYFLVLYYNFGTIFGDPFSGPFGRPKDTAPSTSGVTVNTDTMRYVQSNSSTTDWSSMSPVMAGREQRPLPPPGPDRAHTGETFVYLLRVVGFAVVLFQALGWMGALRRPGVDGGLGGGSLGGGSGPGVAPGGSLHVRRRSRASANPSPSSQQQTQRQLDQQRPSDRPPPIRGRLHGAGQLDRGMR